jgi:DNA-binding CsgD family transcriptional regulator
MDEEAITGFVERIYDQVLDPDHWSDVLAQMATICGGHAAALEQEHAVSERGAGLLFGLDPAIVKNYFDYYAARNVLRRIDGFAGRIKTFVPTITLDEDHLAKPDLMRTEFYGDFLRPIGIHSVMTLGLWGQAESVTALSVYRPAGHASFDQPDRRLAEALQPHLIRAFRLGRQLAEARHLNVGLVAALDRSPYGLVILGPDGRVQHANLAAQRMLAEPGGLAMLAGRLACADTVSSERLRAVIGRAIAPDGRAGGSVALTRPGRAPLSVTVAPFGPERFGALTADRGAIVSITDPEAGATVSDAYLHDVVGLTAAEGRVVRALLQGHSLQRIAEQFDVSPLTIKAHLRRIFEKTGVSRQAELVAYVAGFAAPDRHG